jgi:hypothetical protein
MLNMSFGIAMYKNFSRNVKLIIFCKPTKAVGMLRIASHYIQVTVMLCTYYTFLFLTYVRRSTLSYCFRLLSFHSQFRDNNITSCLLRNHESLVAC